ncbi:hypothetical protein D3C73_1098520 [compost metagenome]
MPGVDHACNRMDIVRIIQPAHIHNIRHIQHDNRLLEVGCHLLQHVLLIIGQPVASLLIGIVLILARRTADHHDSFIRLPPGFRHQLACQRHFLLMPRLCGPTASPVIERVGLDPFLIHSRQIFINRDILLGAQAVQQVGCIRHMYTAARSGAAPIIVHLCSSKNRNAFALPDR